ncbi:TolC family protein [Desulfitobacterium sp. AusDCA]
MQKKYVSALTLLVMASIVFPTYKTLAGSDRTAQIASNTVAMSSLADNTTNASSKDTGSGIAGSATSAGAVSTPSAKAAISSVSTEPSADSSSGSSSSDSAPASTSDPAATPAPAPDMSTLNLSLEDALKMVETSNNDLKLTDSKIQIYDKQNQQALARHASLTVVDEDSRKDRDLNYKRTQWTLDNAKHDRENQLKNLQVDITNQYQTILSLQQQANNIGKQITNLDTTIDQINLQIKLGLQIPSAVYTYNAQRSGLEAMQKLALNSMNSSMNTLKQDLGIDLNRPVVLASPLVTYTKFDDADIDNKIAKSAQTTYDIQKTQQDIEISQIEHDIDFYYDDTQNADTIELSIEDKKATLENLPVTKELSLRKAYNDLKSKENTIEADRLTVEADQINIDVMQKNIEVGKSSNLDLLKLQSTLLTDQNTMQQDVIAYMTAAANFQNSLEQ